MVNNAIEEVDNNNSVANLIDFLDDVSDVNSSGSLNRNLAIAQEQLIEFPSLPSSLESSHHRSRSPEQIEDEILFETQQVAERVATAAVSENIPAATQSSPEFHGFSSQEERVQAESSSDPSW